MYGLAGPINKMSRYTQQIKFVVLKLVNKLKYLDGKI